MFLNFRDKLQAWCCALLLFIVGCPSTEEPALPRVETYEYASLLLLPEAVLLQREGAVHEFSIRAFSADGGAVNPVLNDLEFISSNPAEVSISVDDSGRILATALKPVGSAFLLVRSRSKEGMTSNAVAALVASAKPDVQMVEDARVVFPPPHAAQQAMLASSMPDISSSESSSDVRVGSFWLSEVLKLYETQRDASGRPLQMRTPAVLAGESPALGSLLVASEGAPIAGRVVQAESRDGFSLVQLEHVRLEELFSELHVQLDSESLHALGVVRQEGAFPPVGRQGLSLSDFECEGETGFDPAELSISLPDVELVRDFGYRISPSRMRYMRLKIGAKVRGPLTGKLSFNPEQDAEFRCTLSLDQLDFGPYPIPGPLAAYTSFGVRFRPLLLGKAKITAGPVGELEVGVDLDLSFVHTIEWTEDNGFLITQEDAPGTPIRMREPRTKGPLFSLSLEYLDASVVVDASGEIAAGMEGSIYVAPPLPRLIDWLGGFGLLDKFKLDALRLDATGTLSAQWHWIGKAMQDRYDEEAGRLSAKAVLKPYVLPGVFDLLGRFDVDVGWKGELGTLEKTLWERTALLRKNDEGVSTVVDSEYCKDGSELLRLKADVAGVSDPARGVGVFVVDRWGGEVFKVADLSSQGVGFARWEAMVDYCGFCDSYRDLGRDIGDGVVVLYIYFVGHNRMFEAVPAASFLGVSHVVCGSDSGPSCRERCGEG